MLMFRFWEYMEYYLMADQSLVLKTIVTRGDSTNYEKTESSVFSLYQSE